MAVGTPILWNGKKMWFLERIAILNFQNRHTDRAKKDVIWKALFEPWLRASVERELIAILNSPALLTHFDHNKFDRRIGISQEPYDEPISLLLRYINVITINISKIVNYLKIILLIDFELHESDSRVLFRFSMA
jgi:hypothetical protein